MKEQPNKATVKDGLPTAEEVIDKYPMEKDFWSFVISRESAIQAMQEFSDQQNSELRERVKELEAGNNRILNEVKEINQLTKQSKVNATMRIIELETKNDRLCEALKKIADRFDPETQDFEGIIRIAEGAIKQNEK